MSSLAFISVQLPLCDYRVDISEAELFSCRHTGVRAPGHQVTAEVCRICTMRTVPCNQPRNGEASGSPSQGPSWVQRCLNAASSTIGFARDRLRLVSDEVYAARLAVCDECAERQGDRCRECGCRLSLKARGRAFRCPLGMWEVVGPESVGSQP